MSAFSKFSGNLEVLSSHQKQTNKQRQQKIRGKNPLPYNQHEWNTKLFQNWQKMLIYFW